MTANSLSSTPATARAGQITCRYVNQTTKLQVVRISNIPGYFFERVVFAGQQLLIDVDSEAVLEIHSHELATSIFSDRIPCSRLRYAEALTLPQNNAQPSGQRDGQTSDQISGQMVA